MYIYPFFIMYIGTPCSVHLSFFHLVYWNTLYVHLSFFHLVYWDTLYVHLSFFILYIGIPCSVHLSLFHLGKNTAICLPSILFHISFFINIYLYFCTIWFMVLVILMFIYNIHTRTYIYIYYSYPTYRFFRLISTHSIKTNILLKTIFIDPNLTRKFVKYKMLFSSFIWISEEPTTASLLLQCQYLIVNSENWIFLKNKNFRKCFFFYFLFIDF